jgi:uncharacterized protein (DUF58 family)
MIDESWARVYPYGQTVKEGEVVALSVRITNHSPNATTYKVNWKLPAGWVRVSGENSATIPATRDGEIKARFRVTGLGLHVVTVDVGFGSWQLSSWTEALVRVH